MDGTRSSCCLANRRQETPIPPTTYLLEKSCVILAGANAIASSAIARKKSPGSFLRRHAIRPTPSNHWTPSHAIAALAPSPIQRANVGRQGPAQHGRHGQEISGQDPGEQEPRGEQAEHQLAARLRIEPLWRDEKRRRAKVRGPQQRVRPAQARIATD